MTDETTGKIRSADPEQTGLLPHWKGLTLDILRRTRGFKPEEFSNRGLSSEFEQVTLVGYVDERQNDLRAPTPFSSRVEPIPDRFRMGLHAPRRMAPAAVLVVRAQWDSAIAHVAPWPTPGTPRGQAGGQYVATSDSRVWDFVEDLLGTRMYGALSLHDRFEAGTTGPGPFPVWTEESN